MGLTAMYGEDLDLFAVPPMAMADVLHLFPIREMFGALQPSSARLAGIVEACRGLEGWHRLPHSSIIPK